MLPGVELARRRRLHQRAAAGAAADAASGPIRPDLSSAMGEAALLARSRLRERLRGPEPAAAPAAAYSSFSRATDRIDFSAPSRACTSGGGPDLDVPRSGRHLKNGSKKKTHGWCGNENRHPDAGEPSSAGASPGKGTRRDLAASEAEEICAVCLDALRSQSQRKFLVNLPCSHNYHFDCVRPWLASNSRCPCCRKPVVSL